MWLGDGMTAGHPGHARVGRQASQRSAAAVRVDMSAALASRCRVVCTALRAHGLARLGVAARNALV